MGFKFNRVKGKVQSGRGGADDEKVLGALLDTWDSWSEAVQDMEDAEKAKFVDAFNDVVDDSGDVFTGGDKDEFRYAITTWDDNDKSELVKFLCPEYFEVENDD